MDEYGDDDICKVVPTSYVCWFLTQSNYTNEHQRP